MSKIPSPSAAIDVRDLTRRFGPFTAVDHVTFQVARGEIFGFLGPNGSGKSTTIRMLLGLLRPTSGSARVLGYDVLRQPLELCKNVGYVSQRFSLYPDLTVSENIDFYGRAYNVWGSRLTERRKEVLELTGLAGLQRELTTKLAGGFKQRLALAAAILHEPPLLFLDEPTAGVDPVSRRDFWRLLYRLASEGTTIFLTTHYMDEAEQCHRLAFIHNGRIVATGAPSEIKERQMRGQVVEIACDAPGRALELLRTLEGLRAVALYGNLIHVVSDNVQHHQSLIRAALTNLQITVNRISVIPPSLEDVFIAHSGD